MKIYVAGHRGLVGSAIVRKIEKDGNHTWVGKKRAELNLFDYDAVLEFIKQELPDVVIVAAAKVGGIGANSEHPVEFLNENLHIQLNLLEACHVVGIPRLLFLGSSCIYPKFANQPIEESQLLTGLLEPTNEPYAIAKIVGLKMVEAYASEYGRDWISAMPTNVYGPGDNFDQKTGHVLAALIAKFHAAKANGDSEIQLWGDGSAFREFIYSDDLAAALMLMLEKHHSPTHVNIGSGEEISIRDLSKMVASVVGFNGNITWDLSMPNGTPRKFLDSSKIRSLGWSPKVSLVDGITAAYKSFGESSAASTMD
jgi:GDP-L-fucose synthase